MLDFRVKLARTERNFKENAQRLLDIFLPDTYKKIQKFSPNVKFEIDKGEFLIKTAQTPAELEMALCLRHEVFYEELLSRSQKKALDVDKFDFICDHLLVMDKASGQCIGTYRFNSSLYSKKFYSSTEFKMKKIKELPGNKLELGRACIHKDFRNGITISLLWAGISEYCKATGTKYMFGCSSIKTTDFYQIVSVHKYLSDNFDSGKALRVKPRKKFKVKNLKKHLYFFSKVDSAYKPGLARKLVPSLLKSYLKTGAVICGEPALDMDFKCVDFLTLLDIEKINATVNKKFDVQ